MAVIVSTQVTKIAADGAGELVTLVRISNVTTADTIDVSAMTGPGVAVYRKVKSAIFFVSGALSTNAAASVTGTVLTLTLTNLANDTVYLLIIGEI